MDTISELHSKGFEITFQNEGYTVLICGWVSAGVIDCSFEVVDTESTNYDQGWKNPIKAFRIIIEKVEYYLKNVIALNSSIHTIELNPAGDERLRIYKRLLVKKGIPFSVNNNYIYIEISSITLI